MCGRGRPGPASARALATSCASAIGSAAGNQGYEQIPAIAVAIGELTARREALRSRSARILSVSVAMAYSLHSSLEFPSLRHHFLRRRAREAAPYGFGVERFEPNGQNADDNDRGVLSRHRAWDGFDKIDMGRRFAWKELQTAIRFERVWIESNRMMGNRV